MNDTLFIQYRLYCHRLGKAEGNFRNYKEYIERYADHRIAK